MGMERQRWPDGVDWKGEPTSFHSIFELAGIFERAKLEV